MNYILLVLGFAALIYGASILVTGSSSIAKRFKISDLTIGLTIVAFGTSAPELIVSMISSAHGSNGMAIGNLMGSNLFNTYIILGITALITPILVQKKTIRVEIPYNLLAAGALWILASDIFIDGTPNMISRIDALMLLLFFIIFLYYTMATAKTSDETCAEAPSQKLNMFLSIVMLVGGIILLFLGGKWVVESASYIAHSFGMSDTLIGLTIVAMGTSLPELVTSIIAAIRGNSAIAIGNVVGSNIFNLLFILPLTALITPIPIVDDFTVDLLVTCLSAVFVFAFGIIGKGQRIDQKEGAILILVYVFYFCYLIFH